MPTYSATKAGYANLWKQMKVNTSVVSVATREAKAIIEDRTRYEVVEARTGVPWFWIALVHLRESNRNFKGVLHNGQQIFGTGRVTTLVPKGRGPFSTWEEAAEDALHGKGLDKIDDWPLERCLYQLEDYNGWGYFGKINSPYVWAGTNLYVRGKYVADGQYDPNHIDKQLGTATVLKILTDLSDDVAERLDMLVAEPSPIPGEPSVNPLAAYSEKELVQELNRRDWIRNLWIEAGRDAS